MQSSRLVYRLDHFPQFPEKPCSGGDKFDVLRYLNQAALIVLWVTELCGEVLRDLDAAWKSRRARPPLCVGRTIHQVYAVSEERDEAPVHKQLKHPLEMALEYGVTRAWTARPVLPQLRLLPLGDVPGKAVELLCEQGERTIERLLSASVACRTWG